MSNPASVDVAPTSGAQPTAETIVNISAYKFVPLNDLASLQQQFRSRCRDLGLRGTILLSSEGINMFLAAPRAAIDQFISEVREIAGLGDLQPKESFSATQPFNRMLVKIKREIIAFGIEAIAPSKHTSPKLKPQELKAWLDAGRPVRLLDVRNDYEVDLGTFHGAEQLHIHHFREFPAAAARVSEEAKKQPLVMFCTGGIRCEKAGPMLEQLGFQQVYQLDGGILKYFEDCGGAHYDGGCFVFDSRVVLDPQLKPTGAVQCFHCQAVLSHEDIQSPKFTFGKSCPHCFKTPDEQQHAELAKRQRTLDRVAQSQPGLGPYENRRLLHVPQRLAGKHLIDFLAAYHPPTPLADWHHWIATGAITSQGQAVEAQQVVREGQQFEHTQPDYREPRVAENIQLLFEDEALIVVNKPAPLPVHPSGRFNRNTLAYFLAQVYRPEKLRVAHRLDANTTGLVVLCRKYASARVLQPQFASGTVEKRYVLRVQGHPVEDHLLCEARISDSPTAIGARTVDPNGLEATTRFSVRQRLNDGTSLLEAQPLTGRTNQIRIHAWTLGWPIVGDPLYLPGNHLGTQQTQSTSSQAMCLHAWRLSFRHPFTDEPMTFEAPLPAWFEEARP